MNTIRRWVRFVLSSTFERPGLVVAAASGCAVGILICAPLFHWGLDSGASTVFGAAIGALIGAGAAAAISDAVVNKGDRDLRRTISRVIGPVAWSLGAMLEEIKKAGDAPPTFAVRQLTELRTRVNESIRRIEKIMPVAMSLKGGRGVAVIDAHMVLEHLMAVLPEVSAAVSGASNESTKPGGRPNSYWKATCSIRLDKPFLDLVDSLRKLGADHNFDDPVFSHFPS